MPPRPIRLLSGESTEEISSRRWPDGNNHRWAPIEADVVRGARQLPHSVRPQLPLPELPDLLFKSLGFASEEFIPGSFHVAAAAAAEDPRPSFHDLDTALPFGLQPEPGGSLDG